MTSFHFVTHATNSLLSLFIVIRAESSMRKKRRFLIRIIANEFISYRNKTRPAQSSNRDKLFAKQTHLTTISSTQLNKQSANSHGIIYWNRKNDFQTLSILWCINATMLQFSSHNLLFNSHIYDWIRLFLFLNWFFSSYIFILIGQFIRLCSVQWTMNNEHSILSRCLHYIHWK